MWILFSSLIKRELSYVTGLHVPSHVLCVGCVTQNKLFQQGTELLKSKRINEIKDENFIGKWNMWAVMVPLSPHTCVQALIGEKYNELLHYPNDQTKK